MHRHGSHWRLDALDPAQVAAFEEAARPATTSTLRPPAHAWPLIEALATDGRRSAADLARLAGRNPATVRSQLARLVNSDLLSFRCELAAEVSGWSVSSTWTAHVEAPTTAGPSPPWRRCPSCACACRPSATPTS